MSQLWKGVTVVQDILVIRFLFHIHTRTHHFGNWMCVYSLMKGLETMFSGSHIEWTIFSQWTLNWELSNPKVKYFSVNCSYNDAALVSSNLCSWWWRLSRECVQVSVVCLKLLYGITLMRKLKYWKHLFRISKCVFKSKCEIRARTHTHTDPSICLSVWDVIATLLQSFSNQT
jgi:hypothetical protein